MVFRSQLGAKVSLFRATSKYFKKKRDKFPRTDAVIHKSVTKTKLSR